MSIILKGIDLPDEKLMEMFESDNHICIGGNYYPLMIKDVIQIPKDHGRLIDIEKLKEEFAMKDNICKECDSFKECDNKTYSKSEICENFIWVPTILEAEEVDEHNTERD